jgi:hypothetical protein
MSVLLERLLGQRAQLRGMIADISQLIDEVRAAEKEVEETTTTRKPRTFGSAREIKDHGKDAGTESRESGGERGADDNEYA